MCHRGSWKATVAVLSLVLCVTAPGVRADGLNLIETGGAIDPLGDIGLAGNGAVAFAWDDLASYSQFYFHNTGNLNDGLYGNTESWIGYSLPPATIAPKGFAGIRFAEPMIIDAAAWGRPDWYADRWQGTYALQYTQAANPDQNTLNTDWITIGSADLTSNARHKYGFTAVQATGLRMLVPYVWEENAGMATCVEELEVYGSPVPEPTSLALLVLAAAGLRRK